MIPEPDRAFLEVEKAEAFAREHPHDPTAWTWWAKRQPGQIKALFRRINANVLTTQTHSHPGQPVEFETLDRSIPGRDELYPELCMMVDVALAVWDEEQ
jgi:hypothetical protein